MAEVLVRDLDPEVIQRLESRARLHERSLQGELKSIIEDAARLDWEEARATADRLREELGGREHSDSGTLQAEDRER